MKSRRSCLQAGLAWAAGAAVLGMGPKAAEAQASPATLPFAWPDLGLLDGSTLAPPDWRETGAVLVFWATHCGFCRRHNVHVEKLHRAMAGQPVRVLGLASDREAVTVQRYLRQQGLTFPVSLDVEPLRRQLRLSRTIPTTVTVDRSGRVGLAIPGEMTEEDVMKLAQVALAR